MDEGNEEFFNDNIAELRRTMNTADGKLVKSKISPDDYFINLSYDAPKLRHPDVGISKSVVYICEMISTLLLEDVDDSKHIGRTIVMILEYYFLVGPVIYRSQGKRFVNDFGFMKHFMRYIKSLCVSRTQAQREIGDIIAALEVYNPLGDESK